MSELILFLLFFFLILLGDLARVSLSEETTQGKDTGTTTVSVVDPKQIPGGGSGIGKAGNPIPTKVPIPQKGGGSGTGQPSQPIQPLIGGVPHADGFEKNCLFAYSNSKGKIEYFHPVVFEIIGENVYVRKRNATGVPNEIFGEIEDFGWNKLIGGPYKIGELLRKTNRFVAKAQNKDCYFSSNIKTELIYPLTWPKEFWDSYFKLIDSLTPDNPGLIKKIRKLQRNF